MNITKTARPLSWLGLIAVAMLLAACSGSNEPSRVEQESYTLRLQLRTDGIFSRAAWEDDWYDAWEDGSAFDRTISSLELYIIGEDGRMAPMYALEEKGSAAHIYTCEVDETTPGVSIDSTSQTATFSGKIMAVANIESVTTPWLSPGNDEAKKLPFDVRFSESLDWNIPMWGIASYSDIKIEADKVTMLDDIEMLRAVAKIAIRLDDSIRDLYEIVSVRMAEGSPGFKKSGYAMPEGGLAVSATGKISREECAALRPDAQEFALPPFVKTAAGEVITYVAETRLANGESPIAFDVTLRLKDSQSSPFTGTLYLSAYRQDNLSEPADPIREIVRNHIYQFTIKLAGISFIPSVRVWEFGDKVHIELE